MSAEVQIDLETARQAPPVAAGNERHAEPTTLASFRDASLVASAQSVWPVILWTTIPFWLLMTATRVLGYTVRVAAVPDVQIAEPLERTLQHAILFFILIGVCFRRLWFLRRFRLSLFGRLRWGLRGGDARGLIHLFLRVCRARDDECHNC